MSYLSRIVNRFVTASPPASCEDFSDRNTVVDLQAFAAGDFQPARVEAKLSQDRGVDVGYVVTVLDRVEADFVGRAVCDTPFDTTTRHPDREAVRVMIAAVRSL